MLRKQDFLIAVTLLEPIKNGVESHQNKNECRTEKSCDHTKKAALYAVRKVIRFAASPPNVQVYEKSGSLSKSPRFSKKQNLKTIGTA